MSTLARRRASLRATGNAVHVWRRGVEQLHPTRAMARYSAPLVNGEGLNIQRFVQSKSIPIVTLATCCIIAAM